MANPIRPWLTPSRLGKQRLVEDKSAIEVKPTPSCAMRPIDGYTAFRTRPGSDRVPTPSPLPNYTSTTNDPSPYELPQAPRLRSLPTTRRRLRCQDRDQAAQRLLRTTCYACPLARPRRTTRPRCWMRSRNLCRATPPARGHRHRYRRQRTHALSCQKATRP